MGQKQSQASRLNELRKYIPTPEDAAIVKEMITDGLSNEDILHALGYVSGAPKVSGVLPNGHEFSNKMTTEQEEREAQAAELGQPGGAEGGNGDPGEDDGEDNMLSHVAGLLNHVTKKKAKNRPQGAGTGGNGR